MRVRVLEKLKSWLGNQENPEQGESEHVAQAPFLDKNVPINPVEEFYRSLLKKDLTTFSKFALQSRSIVIRDVFAREATYGRLGYLSLVNEIDASTYDDWGQNLRNAESPKYNPRILLALASLLLNSARNDLDSQTGVQIYRFVLEHHGDDALSGYDKLQYVEALGELRRYGEQSSLIRRFKIADIAPLQAELMNIDRLAYDSPAEEWLEALNGVYENLDMVRIQIDSDTSMPLMDRLESSTSLRCDGPKISVIMPTYAPDHGIWTALRSLLQQTWSNLEVIVIDDGSPTSYDGFLSKIERLDSRIRLVRQTENLGAYSARNAGLALATGDFITVHDDDDWSHPEKLAVQAQVLLNDESVVATTSAHIRSTENMQFRRVNTKPKHLQTNYSSLMFRKDIMNDIGPWDTTNRGSDAEFAIRIAQNYGTSAVVHLTDKPLSFSRVWSGSLTSGEMYRGFFAYSRLLFRGAFRDWHKKTKRSGSSPVLLPHEPRPYAVPTTFEPGSRNKDLGVFDVVYLTDFAKQAKFSATVLQEIETAAQAGLRVGYMHIDSPQTPRRGDFHPRLFELQLAGHVVQVSENNQAETDLLLVYDASVGMFLDQFKSTLVVQQGLLVEDKGVSLSGTTRREAANVKQALQNLDNGFDITFEVVGASKKEHHNLHNNVPPARLHDDKLIWETHVHAEPAEISAPSDTPVIGFHSFGNKYRWPANQQVFKTVYFSNDHKTMLYGVMHPARKQFGGDVLARAEILDRNSYSLESFFDAIDFWIYFPNERLQDRVWLPVLDAMQAGLVVILPKHLEPLYGDAAVYSDVTEVASVVAALSGDSKEYISQATRGQDFVAAGFDKQSYVRRLAMAAGKGNFNELDF